jgi:acyl-CoA synthetase (AMP-forming)/AMP-acid ligase II/NAD(P)-dependent dehydrogenase (short-subunit alcohol dehydrogenase family)/acyl carrier protein
LLFADHPGRETDGVDLKSDALYLLTSGSTGKPKVVRHTHETLFNGCAGMAEILHLTPADISMNWMPLDHVGGIVMFHLRDVFAEASQVHVHNEIILREPLRWLDIIDEHRATITWAPNFAFKLVNESIERSDVRSRSWDLSCLKQIMNAGEAIVPQTARRFLADLIPYGLPETSMVPVWGMSETCSGVLYSRTFRLDTTSDADRFTVVGSPVSYFSLRITDESNTIKEEKEIGKLQVKGAMVTPGYLNRDDLNAEAFTPDGWYETGDLAFIEEGQVTITGRTKDAIIVNGINYYCHEIEAVIETLRGVEPSFTAATAIRFPGDNTDRLAVFFVTAFPEWSEKLSLIKHIRSTVLENIGLNPHVILPVEPGEIPKTAIGKIQRSQLGSRYMNGEFDRVLARIEIESGAGESVPNWFLKKTWRPAPPGPETVPLTGRRVLIFGNPRGLGERTGEVLEKAGAVCFHCEEGISFEIIGAARCRLNPGDEDHYRRLFRHLDDAGFALDDILFLLPFTQCGNPGTREELESALDKGVSGVVRLIHALSASPRKGLRLCVVSRQAYEVISGEDTVFLHTGVYGLLRSLDQEEPWLECRQIDLESSGDAGEIALELSAREREQITAYRSKERYKPYLEPLDLRNEPIAEIPLRREGRYLLIGGLGGIGGFFAEQLIRQYSARLLIIGRTRLNEGNLTENSDGDERRDRFQALKSLKDKGGEIIYEAADVANLDELKGAAARAETLWGGPLDGIFHFAGEENLARHWSESEAHRTATERLETYDSMFRAKAGGTLNLFELTRTRPETLLVVFSSVAGEIGNATFSAYAAANSFQDNCCRYHAIHGFPNTFCLNWSIWDDLGMSRGNPEFARIATRRMGYNLIQKRDGWNSFLTAISRGEHRLYIGLDSGNRHLEDRIVRQADRREKVTVFLSAEGNGEATAAALAMARETLHTTIPLEIVRVHSIPRGPDGTVDMESLVRKPDEANGPVSGREKPRSGAEREIACIWKDILQIEEIGIHDNFFDLGGNSLLIVKLSGRIREEFSRDVSMTDLFRYPTIQSLAVFLSGEGADREKERTLDLSRQRGAARRERNRKPRGAAT